MLRNSPEATTPQGNESRYFLTDFYELPGIPNKAAEEANVPLETAEVLFEFLGRDKLDVGRIRVDDRIREDLRLDKVLWWDWDLDLYEEYVGRSLPVSRIRKGGAVAVIVTVRDLLRFLAEARSPSG